jgi:dTDP-glucose 4,6-dehydratase/UDP-glucose 4-epimerase
MRYLVTGGTGFLGSAFTRRLVKRGETVRVLDNNVRGRADRLESVAKDVELVQGDVRNYEGVKRACKGVDSVWHFAMINGTEFFYSHPDLVVDVGVAGTLNTIKAAAECGVREMVVASSSEAYGTPPVVPTPETVPLVIPDPSNPRFSYGASKAIAEVMAFSFARAFQRTMVFRPHNVYGADMGWEHVVPQFALRMTALVEQHGAKATIPFPIQGDGSETRAFVHVDDFTDGLERMLERGADREVYHLGTSEETTIATLAHAVAKCLGVRIELMKGELLKGSTPRRCPDISKARQQLGYAPRITLEAGLPDVVEWYRAHAGERRSATLTHSV